MRILQNIPLAHRVFPDMSGFQQVLFLAGIVALFIGLVTSFVVRKRRSSRKVGIVWISLCVVAFSAACNFITLAFVGVILFPVSLLALIPFAIIAFNMRT